MIQRDVFLSYSHDDEDVVKAIAGLLNSELGLSVFIDSMFWGSADGLLKEIDEKYCKSDSPHYTYDYRKRNFSTSHIHAMLTASIMKVMDEAEIVIFINTPNSAPDLERTIDNNGYDEFTLSPWIYEEILFTNLLRKRDWTEYRMRMLTESESQRFNLYEKPNIKYKLPSDSLIKLSLQDIKTWVDEYNKE